MLEMENEEIRLFSKELMKKYSIKKKEKELREKEE
jgi:hypothetical protein